MVKLIKYTRFLPFIILLNSCYSEINIQKRIAKNLTKFDKSNFPGIRFDKLYILEGTYETKKDFELIYPKLEVHTNGKYLQYLQYLYVHGNGELNFFTLPEGYLTNKLSNYNKQDSIGRKQYSFNGVMYIKNNKLIIERTQLYKMYGGYGSYREKLKIISENIYIQEANRCYVYKYVE